MVTVFIVTPADTSEGFMSRSEMQAFTDTRQRMLGYTEASVQVPDGPGRTQLRRLPLGACPTQEEAQKVIDALATASPGRSFRVDPMTYHNADNIVWHGAD